MNLTRGIDLKKIAEKMNGCSGAELKGVCTEAGMYALRERRIHVTQEDFGKNTIPLQSWFNVFLVLGINRKIGWFLTI